MTLITPAWLWLLLPWAAVVVLVLRGYRPRVFVPFLDLWPRDAGEAEKRRAWRWPPWPLVLLALALVIVIISLCRPAMEQNPPKLGKLTIVVDRGITMKAGGRLAKTAELTNFVLQPLLADDAEIRVVGSDGVEVVSGPLNLTNAIVGKGAGVTDQHATLRGLVAREISADPIVVVSDLEVRDSRAVVIPPRGRVRNVGITSIAADGEEVLFGVRNDSELKEVNVVITVGEIRRSYRETLPKRGAQREYVRLAKGWPVRVEIQVKDDLADDNQAEAGPEHLAPRIRNTVSSPALGKFVAAYGNARRAMQNAPLVQIGTESTAGRAAILARGERVGRLETAVLPEHAILRSVRFPDQARIAGGPLPAGDWSVLLRSGERPALAVEEATRRVWVGFESAEWEETQGFPIFWTNVVEWLGGEAKPGTGNVFAPRFSTEQPFDPEAVRQRLRGRAVIAGRVEVGRYGWVGAACLVAGAVGVAVFMRPELR